MGYAVGVIGMRLDDFDAMTLREFEAVADAHREHNEGIMRDAWERMRLHAGIVIQPHCKKKLSPKDLLSFPWDKKKSADEVPQLSREEHEARFRRLVEEANKR